MGCLILAGESIYMLPYMRRTFQTSMESVFEVTSTQLGVINSMYGVLALICYFPGGWLADRVSDRKLLTFSLVSTGVIGLYVSSIPGYIELLVLHGLWGITAILTFWAALIRAARNWGSADEQGRTFGILDGGRGIISGALATLATTLFAIYQASSTEAGLKAVILFYALTSIGAGVAIWFVIPEADTRGSNGGEEFDKATAGEMQISLKEQILDVLKMKEVWLQAFVVMTA